MQFFAGIDVAKIGLDHERHNPRLSISALANNAYGVSPTPCAQVAPAVGLDPVGVDY
ncbi:hypothetical protein [uncultured Rhodoblastus sp.]|uniref:hypothetical protein n=1 Tax=uncultured Rhodoblastus sp. TaxID=543037 RepID=UPI0025F9B03F|nr:hypothetical protein [uncultured Rhodoblastus sp.]